MDGNQIVNYYESKVFEEIQRFMDNCATSYDEDIFYDIACITLNQLPCRYVRFSVDATFYLKAEERDIMDKNIKMAVEKAFNAVMKNPRKH